MAACAFALSSVASAAIPDSERTVLLALYTNTTGVGWLASTGWNGPPGTECSWFGITCDAAQAHVVAIELPNNNLLPGPLPALDALTELALFDVHSDTCSLGCFPNTNQISGPIPALPSHITDFDAAGVGLSGPIPTLSSFAELQTFNVASNGLTGPIPSLTGMLPLQYFVVSGNQLTGSLPDLTGLANLRWFVVGSNPITGTIPPSLSTATSLENIDISNTTLEGEIPSLSALVHLQSFTADSAHLSGPIPPLAGLVNLGAFSVQDNALTGTIPDLNGLSQLTFFYLNGNQLTGAIPSLAGLSNLNIFSVSDNQLTGSLPDIVGQGLTNISAFIASNNALTGSIPSLAGLETQYSFTFDVDRNQLTGSLPSLTGATNLFYFSAAYNQLSGSIPSLAGPIDLAYYVVDDNALTGSIPALSDSRQLTIFDVSNNRLTGTIPSFAGTHLTEFDADNNDLTGPLPDLSTVSDTLNRIDVAFNHLSGTVSDASLNLQMGGTSMLCPNQFTDQANVSWDVATDTSPWYAACASSYVNLNQFGLTGSWYEPATEGQGWLMEAMPDVNGDGAGVLFGGWFTYLCTIYDVCAVDDTTVRAQHWYSVQGNIDADDPYATLTIYENEGGDFAAPPVTVAQPVGTVAIAFTDCTHGILTYRFASNNFVRGTIPLTRLTSNTACVDSENSAPAAPSNSLLSGAWYDPTTSGQGIIFDISAAQNVLFAGWYTYADAGADEDPSTGQRWYSLQTSFAPGATSFDDVPIYASTGGLFDYTSVVNTVEVGNANITFESCTAVTIDYAFTSGENAGVTGTLHLSRLNAPQQGCGE